MKHFYVTSPIYYVNDIPHVGHFYTTLIGDVIARFRSLEGYEVKFTTGTDEHGQKVERAAQSRGVPVQEFVDKNSERFRELIEKCEFSCTDFVRTTEARHHSAVTALWKRLKDNDQIYLGRYSGFYSVRDEAFYRERELVDGKAPTGAEVEWLEESSYFFKLSEWREVLLKFYEDNPDFVVPRGKFNEVIRFVESGLKDLSVSRSRDGMSWGIGVPGDAQHLIYVWVDALPSYITALGFPEMSEEYRNCWEDNSAENVHIIGKDILRFHAVYWPALLMAARLPLPRKIVAHGWWLNEGQKISKSLGNVMDPLEVIQEFNLDGLRYFLLREAPIGNDASFNRDRFIECVNGELADNLGNLTQRVLTLIHKECEGVVPNVDRDRLKGDESLPDYDDILGRYRCCMEDYRFFDALKLVVSLSSDANAYISRRVPWELCKRDKECAYAVLFKSLEYVRCIGLLLQPFVPRLSSNVLDQIALPHDKRDFAHFSVLNEGGTVLRRNPTPVFQRFS